MTDEVKDGKTVVECIPENRPTASMCAVDDATQPKAPEDSSQPKAPEDSVEKPPSGK